MTRFSIFLLVLLATQPALASDAVQASGDATAAPEAGSPSPDTPAATVSLPATQPLPPMYFLSTVASDDLLALLKAEEALASLDKELVGSPLTLMVTHTVRPTAGGQAAGFLTAMLSGSTLGLIPIVSNERLVIRYEVLLNGKTVTSYNFERTATRAQNLWTAGADGHGGLGKAGIEWVKSTAAEAAGQIARDPAMIAVRDEIAFYFAATPAAAGATATGR